MALLEARAGNAHEAGLRPERLDVRAAAVAHAGAQATHHLEYCVGHGPLVGHTALDALGHELLRAGLEVAVSGAFLHGADAAHAAVDLELAALEDLALAGAFLAAREHGAHHDDPRACGQSLHDITGVLDAAVGNDGDAVLVGHGCRLEHGGYLRHAYAGDHAGGADGAGADANLDAVRPRLYECLGSLGRGDVAGNELYLGEGVLHKAHAAHDIRRVAVRRVEHKRVHACLDKRAGTVEYVVRHADGGGAEQAPVPVLGRVRVFDDLFNVLYRYKPLEAELLVHYGQLFYLVPAEDVLGLLERGALPAGDEALTGHDLADAGVHVLLKLHVAVRDDADEHAVGVHDRHAGDAVLRHERVRLAEGVVRPQIEWVRDDAVLRTLDHIDLLGLVVYRHALVDDADAALARYGDGHAVFRHGVHGRAHDGRVEPDGLGQVRGQVDVGRQDAALRRDEQYVVKGQALADKALGKAVQPVHMKRTSAKNFVYAIPHILSQPRPKSTISASHPTEKAGVPRPLF